MFICGFTSFVFRRAAHGKPREIPEGATASILKGNYGSYLIAPAIFPIVPTQKIDVESEPSRDVSILIRETRHLLQLSQTEFAAKLGVSFHSVNRWENGRTHPLPLALKQVEVLLHQLGKPGEALLARYFTQGEPHS